MGDELNENTVKIVPIHNEYVLFSSELQIPINPMIGVIGTAPKEESISCGKPHDHGGIWTVKKLKKEQHYYYQLMSQEHYKIR